MVFPSQPLSPQRNGALKLAEKQQQPFPLRRRGEAMTDKMDEAGYLNQCHEFTEKVRDMLGAGYGMGYQLDDLWRVLEARNQEFLSIHSLRSRAEKAEAERVQLWNDNRDLRGTIDVEKAVALAERYRAETAEATCEKLAAQLEEALRGSGVKQ
jgi:hypothetical protein